jgi:hypothetical protein
MSSLYSVPDANNQAYPHPEGVAGQLEYVTPQGKIDRLRPTLITITGGVDSSTVASTNIPNGSNGNPLV